MTGVQKQVFRPIAKNAAVYNRLFKLYRSLHDSFGIKGTRQDLSRVMKDLLAIRDQARL